MKNTTITFLLLLTASSVSYADLLRGGYGACVSEDLLNQYTTASAKNDKHATQQLLKNGCFTTEAGTKISVLDATWTGITKAKAQIGNVVKVLWTSTENTVR